MTSLEQRERGHERKYMHDQEMKFRVRARNIKLLGLWAAEQLGKEGDGAELYAKGLILTDFEAESDEEYLAKLQADLASGGIELPLDDIIRQRDQLHRLAYDQVMGNA